MLCYLIISFVCLGYIIKYWKRGITHPNAIFFSFAFLYLPFKYFFIKIFAFNYTEPANTVGNLSGTGAVEVAGLFLLI